MRRMSWYGYAEPHWRAATGSSGAPAGRNCSPAHGIFCGRLHAPAAAARPCTRYLPHRRMALPAWYRKASASLVYDGTAELANIYAELANIYMSVTHGGPYFFAPEQVCNILSLTAAILKWHGGVAAPLCGMLSAGGAWSVNCGWRLRQDLVGNIRLSFFAFGFCTPSSSSPAHRCSCKV